jgi:Ethylbenzene dehydrogenase
MSKETAMGRNRPSHSQKNISLLAACMLTACGSPPTETPAVAEATGAEAPAAAAAPAAPRHIIDNSAALSTLVAQTVAVDLSKPEPDAVYWDRVVGGTVTLMGQPMINPRPEATTTDTVQVQALHDGTRVAFRLRWKDSEVSEAGHLAKFSDAIALEFPQQADSLPPVMMGAVGLPVSLYHWRAQYQRDEEHGKPTIEQLYPNASIDMYEHEYKTAPVGSKDAAEKYSPAKTLGNPQAYPKKAVDVIVAEGFSSTAVQDNDGAAARGEWKDGYWTVVISRPLRSPVGGELKPGATSYIAFAAWQGGKNEVASRKCVTMAWVPLEIR